MFSRLSAHKSILTHFASSGDRSRKLLQRYLLHVRSSISIYPRLNPSKVYRKLPEDLYNCPLCYLRLCNMVRYLRERRHKFSAFMMFSTTFINHVRSLRGDIYRLDNLFHLRGRYINTMRSYGHITLESFSSSQWMHYPKLIVRFSSRSI
jgi:hypothetical protein